MPKGIFKRQPLSRKTKEKISKAHKGKKHSIKTKMKIRDSALRRFENPENHPSWGGKFSKSKEYIRNQGFIQKYNITYNDVLNLFEKQNQKCAICGKKIKLGGVGSNCAYVDHNHTTKKVRGLLCSGCNMGLGGFKDSIENLLLAINYIGKSRNTGSGVI